jgi:hypothetical protein
MGSQPGDQIDPEASVTRLYAEYNGKGVEILLPGNTPPAFVKRAFGMAWEALLREEIMAGASDRERLEAILNADLDER